MRNWMKDFLEERREKDIKFTAFLVKYALDGEQYKEATAIINKFRKERDNEAVLRVLHLVQQWLREDEERRGQATK